MINYKKPLIFNITKTNKKKQNLETDQINYTDDGEYKKRAPWLIDVILNLPQRKMRQ
jgi:hypothetical protein